VTLNPRPLSSDHPRGLSGHRSGIRGRRGEPRPERRTNTTVEIHQGVSAPSQTSAEPSEDSSTRNLGEPTSHPKSRDTTLRRPTSSGRGPNSCTAHGATTGIRQLTPRSAQTRLNSRQMTLKVFQHVPTISQGAEPPGPGSGSDFNEFCDFPPDPETPTHSFTWTPIPLYNRRPTTPGQTSPCHTRCPLPLDPGRPHEGRANQHRRSFETARAPRLRDHPRRSKPELLPRPPEFIRANF